MQCEDQHGDVVGDKLAIKLVSREQFLIFNLFSDPVPGRYYRVIRTDGNMEQWKLLTIDESTGLLLMANAVS